MDFINIIGTFFDNSIEHVAALAQLIKDLRLNKNQLDINEDLYDLIRITKETKDKCKGYFDNYYSLNLNVPIPHIGDWAIVKNLDDDKWYIYKCVVEGYWKATLEEYQSNINLVEYAKRNDLKTINGQTILGGGDLQVGHYDPADSQHDGLMSSENYVSLITIKNEVIPQIKESIDHILLLFGGNEVTESIQTVLDRYNQIAEFITSLGDNDNGLILYDILRDIADFKDFITSAEAQFVEIKAELSDVKDDNTSIHLLIDLLLERVNQINLNLSQINNLIDGLRSDLNTQISNVNNRIDTVVQDININISNTINRINTKVSSLEDSIDAENLRATAAEQSLNNRITELEQHPVYPGGGDSIKHIFLTQEEYDALESYEVDAIYLIIERIESNTHFGDRFPLIFG